MFDGVGAAICVYNCCGCRLAAKHKMPNMPTMIQLSYTTNNQTYSAKNNVPCFRSNPHWRGTPFIHLYFDFQLWKPVYNSRDTWLRSSVIISQILKANNCSNSKDLDVSSAYLLSPKQDLLWQCYHSVTFCLMMFKVSKNNSSKHFGLQCSSSCCSHSPQNPTCTSLLEKNRMVQCVSTSWHRELHHKQGQWVTGFARTSECKFLLKRTQNSWSRKAKE